MVQQARRRPRPNLRHLRIFSLAVAERSISRAAESAHVTQSAVSQAVAKLETFFDCRLLERSSSGVLPTELGNVVVERADRALDQLRAAAQRASRLQNQHSPARGTPERRVSAQQLDAFHSTARSGSFREAAKRLGLTQTSVQRAVRQLEETLGSDLLEQTSLGLKPTRSGAGFATAAALILQEVDLISNDLDEAQGRHRGRCSIGSLAFGQAELVPRAITRVVTNFPEVQFTIQDGAYDQLLQSLRFGELDIVVAARRPVRPKDLIEVELFKDVLEVVVRADHPLTHTGVSRIEDLRRFRWILPQRGTTARERCHDLLKRIGGGASAGAIETGALASRRALLLDSDRLTLLSRHQIAADLENGSLAVLAVPLPPIRRSIVAIQRRDWKPTAVQTAVVEALQAVAEEWRGDSDGLDASA